MANGATCETSDNRLFPANACMRSSRGGVTKSYNVARFRPGNGRLPQAEPEVSSFTVRHIAKMEVRMARGAMHVTTMRFARPIIHRRLRIERPRMFSTTRPLKDDKSDIRVTDRMSLKDRTFLVTGGGRGIGFAICKSIAQLGGSVAVIDQLPEPVEEFHQLAEKYGIKAHYTHGDVTNQDSLEAAFSDLASKAGKFNGCVAAAGVALDKPFLEHQWDEAQRILAVNTMGCFWTVKLVAEHMVQHGEGGSIIMIASIAAQGGKIPMQNLSIYNMSKAAVKGLVGPLSVELAEKRIRVNTVSPGVVRSPMTAGQEVQNPELFHMFQNATPLQRMGEPSDLTPAVVYLLSDASSWTTGADFVITGGLHAGSSPSWSSK